MDDHLLGLPSPSQLTNPSNQTHQPIKPNSPTHQTQLTNLTSYLRAMPRRIWTASSLVGSGTDTGWKRRSKASWQNIDRLQQLLWHWESWQNWKVVFVCFFVLFFCCLFLCQIGICCKDLFLCLSPFVPNCNMLYIYIYICSVVARPVFPGLRR